MNDVTNIMLGLKSKCLDGYWFHNFVRSINVLGYKHKLNHVNTVWLD